MAGRCNAGIGSRCQVQHYRTIFAPTVKPGEDVTQRRQHSLVGEYCRRQIDRSTTQQLAQRPGRNASLLCMRATQIEDSAATQQNDARATSAATLICAPITADSTAGVLKVRLWHCRS